MHTCRWCMHARKEAASAWAREEGEQSVDVTSGAGEAEGEVAASVFGPAGLGSTLGDTRVAFGCPKGLPASYFEQQSARSLLHERSCSQKKTKNKPRVVQRQHKSTSLPVHLPVSGEPFQSPDGP